ncbi:MAG: sarcosine oxidase subunit gamma [Proteobacteria bacterium]|jgi:sarcosine oxidase subunit gamma|nr:sarcosine oxidase subunit gamma [Pseudomonadota bacterium]
MASTSQKSTSLPGRTALHGKAMTMHPNPNSGKPGLVFCELAHLGKLNMRADKSAGKMVKSITGCMFPPAANTFTSAGERHAVWLGPDEFMIICEAGKDEELASSIQASFGNRHAAVTNITDALAAFHLKGAAVRQVLAKGCALDLHHSSFTSGDAAQTLLSHAAVTIMALADDEFIVICRTSFASYLHDWLLDAALEYGVKFNK